MINNITHPYLRDAALEDLPWLAQRLREADKMEIAGFSGIDPLLGMMNGLAVSEITKIMLSPKTGDPIGILGVVRDEYGGLIWMHGTADLEKVSMSFLRHCRPVLAQLHEVYPILHNIADARNEVHIKWLKWLGFTFINRYECVGVGGIPALEFVSIRRFDV